MNIVYGFQKHSVSIPLEKSNKAVDAPQAPIQVESAETFKACCSNCNQTIVDQKDRTIWAFYGKCRHCWSQMMWQQDT